MTLRERIDQDLREAQKARDSVRVECLRMLKARMLEREVAQRATEGLDYRLPDPEAQAVIASYGKQRRESIESFAKGGRADLVQREEAELRIVEGYLPRQLDEGQLRELVGQVIAESGASGIKDLGAVMKAVLAQARGAADGKLVNRIVREALERPPAA
jgi:uncharacterized protein